MHVPIQNLYTQNTYFLIEHTHNFASIKTKIIFILQN